MTVIPERANQLDHVTLDHGSHSDFATGHCAMEVVSWLAGEGFTDAPACASPVLARYTIRLNDRWDDEQRQALKPFLPRMIGTGNDGKDELREQIATRFLCTDLLGPWLRLAGMNERADALSSLTAATPRQIREALYAARDEVWERRRAARDVLKEKVLEHLKNKGSVAVAAAAAVAVAAADADAVAVAVADAAAAAAAVAAAAADADAVAVADAAAAAAAVAAADAVAAAAAAADAAAPSWRRYEAAYEAARNYYREHPLAITTKIRELAEQQRPLALTLLEQLIAPSPSTVDGGAR